MDPISRAVSSVLEEPCSRRTGYAEGGVRHDGVGTKSTAVKAP